MHSCTAHINVLDTRSVESREKCVCVCACVCTCRRKVSLSEFKGKVYVAVREFYVGKDGQDAPGAKGLNLTADQWRTLSQQAQAFTDTVVPQ